MLPLHRLHLLFPTVSDLKNGFSDMMNQIPGLMEFVKKNTGSSKGRVHVLNVGEVLSLVLGCCEHLTSLTFYPPRSIGEHIQRNLVLRNHSRLLCTFALYVPMEL